MIKDCCLTATFFGEEKMADFMTAVKWMKEGKENILVNGEELFSGSWKEFCMGDFTLKDEDSEWNLKTYTTSAECWKNNTKTFHIVDVKKCRDLIFKDLGFKIDTEESDCSIKMSTVWRVINKRFGDL